MKQPLSDSSCPANHRLSSYEPTSVLDPIIATSSGSPATAASVPAQHLQATPHHPPDDWDTLSWLLSPDHKDDGAGDLFSLNAYHSSPLDVLADPLDPYCSPPAESYELHHLRAAAEAIWSGDSAAANGTLARLTQALPHPPRTPPQRAAYHFAEALQSLLAAPDQFLAQPDRPASSAADVIRRIGAQRAFACLSPIPQFASFTANQTLLEAFEAADAAAPFHVVDFDLGLGGQWSSFVEEVAARRKQHAAPAAVRVTAVVREETAETLLAADNLRDFACGLGVRFAIDVVRLDALAVGSVRASGDEAVAVVLSPAIFRHLAATRPDASDALLEFIRGADPRVVVLVDAEVALGDGEGVAPLMRGVESCAVLTESVEAAAAADEDAVGRVDRGVVRERAYAAVRSWWSRCEPWKETVVRARWVPAALSDLAAAQADWIVRRAPVEGYHVVRRDGALVLCWHGYDLAATSAWRC